MVAFLSVKVTCGEQLLQRVAKNFWFVGKAVLQLDAAFA